MSNSSKYTKTINFTAEQIAQGAVQGASIDSELSNVANAYNTNAERLDEMRRSDSTKSKPRVNNTIVGLEALGADVLSTIALFRDTPDPLSLIRGEWVTGRAYKRNEIITTTVTINEAKDTVQFVVSDGTNTTTFETQGSVIDTAQSITVTGTGTNTIQTTTSVGLSGGLSETGSYICLIDHTSNDFTVDLGNDRWFQFAGNSLTGIGTDITTSAAASAAAALVSENNASTSETNAATSATNASTSETNAGTSETNAAASEAGAAADAVTASTAATNAGISEANASTSETNASTSETNASTSETNASTSETNAGNSETSAAASAANLQGTSTTSVPIGTGGKIFTTQAGKSFAAGKWLLITSDADPSNYMHGQVSSFVTTTLTINITNTGGSGTFADWTIDVAGTQGAIGPVGPAGASGGLRLAFNTATADADQGDAQVWANNSDLSLATLLFVDNVDSGATNIASQVATWDDSTSANRGKITISQDADPTNFVTYDIIGANALGSGYTKLSVAINGVPGGTLSNTDAVGVAFVRTGDEGATGPGTGDLLAANDLSDVNSATTSATNLGLGALSDVIFGTVSIPAHIATSDIDHAVNIVMDAAGNVGASAQNITYNAGVIVPGDAVTINALSIDQTSSTGGNIVGNLVSATATGDANVYALGAGAGVSPMLQASGVFDDMDSALVNAVDERADLINSGANTPIFVANADTVTIGDAEKFTQMQFILDTFAGGAGVNPTFEFSTGVGTFSAFAPNDGTNGFRVNGTIGWLVSDIPGWVVGAGSEFLIRITRTQGGLGTTPVASFVQIILNLIFQWDENGKIDVRELQLRGPITIPQGVDLASAATVVIGTDSDSFDLTGTTTVTGFTVTAGRKVQTRTTGILTLTNSGSMALPGGNILTAAGDVQTWFATADNTVVCVNYERADGTPVIGVTSVASGDGLFGGPITGSGTIAVDATVARRNAANDMLDNIISNVRVVPGANFTGVTVGSDLASSATIVIPTDGDYSDLTGTTTVSTMTVAIDRHFTLKSIGGLTLTAGAPIVTIDGSDLVLAAGQTVTLQSTAANVVQVVSVGAGGGGSGGTTVIAEFSDTGVSTLDITGFDAVKFSSYRIIWNSQYTAGSGQTSLRTSSDGGVSFDSGASDYSFFSVQAGITGGAIEVYQIDESESFIRLIEDNSSGAASKFSGTIDIIEPGDSASIDQAVSCMSWGNRNTSTLAHQEIHGSRLTAGIVDAIQLIAQTGNFTNITAVLIGVNRL